MDLLSELKNLTQKFNQSDIDYALCDGLAMAVYAKPRVTLDIDFMIHPDSLSKAKEAAGKIGFDFQALPMKFDKGIGMVGMGRNGEEHGPVHPVLVHGI